MTDNTSRLGEGVYEVGDTLITKDGVTLKAFLAATDGSCCYVCDDGKDKCYFVDGTHGECPKCHSDKWAFDDFLGQRVIFKQV